MNRCKHNFYPFIYGVSKPMYENTNTSKETLEKIDKISKESWKKIDIKKINAKNQKLFRKNVIDKYNSLREIQRLSPGIMYLYQNINSVYESPEYCLQRKATIYKKEKNMDLAIECLKKSNELMPYSKFLYTENDYLRLVKYLEKTNRIDEAKKELKHIKILSNSKKQVTLSDYIMYLCRKLFIKKG